MLPSSLPEPLSCPPPTPSGHRKVNIESPILSTPADVESSEGAMGTQYVVCHIRDPRAERMASARCHCQLPGKGTAASSLISVMIGLDARDSQYASFHARKQLGICSVRGRRTLRVVLGLMRPHLIVFVTEGLLRGMRGLRCSGNRPTILTSIRVTNEFSQAAS